MTAVITSTHIELIEGAMGPKPVIAGRNILVHSIVAMHVMNNTPIQWIAEHYDLSCAQIYAALTYYYDNQEQIDREIQEADKLTEELGVSATEQLEQMRQRMKEKTE
jgi:uncharacterized protein (DUF433 family)